MALPALLANIISWLRAGYPQGVPESDYLPLFALLARRLSDDEVRRVADVLVEQGDIPVDKADIGVMITKVTNEMPSASDVARVRARLVAAGWPVGDD